MATSQDFIDFVCDQVDNQWKVRFRKMFGEYMIYVNNKPILLVCGDTVYIKKLPALSTILENASSGAPYSGAKEHYILDPEDREILNSVITILEPITPIPAARKKRAKQ